MRAAPLLLVLLGCSDPKVQDPGPSSTPEDSGTPDSSTQDSDSPEDPPVPEDTAPIEDIGAAEEPVVEEEDLPNSEVWELNDWIFSEDEVHFVDITVDAAAMAALASSPYTYVKADLSFDGIAVSSVGVRVKGKYGSYRSFGSKSSLKLDFDRYVDDQEFYGLKKLNLNNSIVDCSYMHDRVAYKLHELVGNPYSRTGYAWVTINGEDEGLYIIIEALDIRYLERNYKDPSGNFYDGKYQLLSSGGYALADFMEGSDQYFAMQEGTDVALADVAAITDAVVIAHEAEMFYAGMEPYLDWDQILNEWSVEQWIGQNDGYVMNKNNYFIYFDPTDGKAEMIPWDLDYSFLYDYQWGMSWAIPRGVLAADCLHDELCTAQWSSAVERMHSTLDEDALRAFAEKIAEQASAYGAYDPHASCSVSDQAWYRSYALSWLAGATAAQRAYWGLE